MARNDYGDFIESWKVELIRIRARRFCFREDEMSDLEQLIVPQLAEVDFDPDAPGGASERTFVTSVIDRQLAKVKRDRGRDVRRVNYESLYIDDKEALSPEELSSLSRSHKHGLVLDVQRALAELPPEQRSICRALQDGLSQAEIARETGRSKTAICNEVRKLRETFEAWEFDEYLGRERDSLS